MHIIFGLINSFVFLVAFFIQRPKIKNTPHFIYIFLTVLMHVFLFGLNVLQEIILLTLLMILLIYKERVFFQLSLLITFRCATYQFLAYILLDGVDKFCHVNLGGYQLIFDSLVVSFFVIIIHLIFSLVGRLGYTISKKFFILECTFYILLYFTKLYIQVSSYVFSYIFINEYQQNFFKMTYWALAVIFLLSCLVLSYSFQNIKRVEQDKAQEAMSVAINRYLSQRVFSSKLFVHDQIHLLNQFRKQMTSMSHQTLIYELDRLIDELQSKDRAFLDLAFIEPIALQYHLYNHLIYLQQMGVDCFVEIHDKVTYIKPILHLMNFLDRLFEEALAIIQQNEKKNISIAILEDGEDLLILLTVYDGKGSSISQQSNWKGLMEEFRFNRINMYYNPATKQTSWEVALPNSKEG